MLAGGIVEVLVPPVELNLEIFDSKPLFFISGVSILDLFRLILSEGIGLDGPLEPVLELPSPRPTPLEGEFGLTEATPLSEMEFKPD